ncbi:Porphobilinogen deaminase [Anaerohalosphaera lusitana]|uniref:Porphobilinogen deaminase n=1 Tax=Anaerohalosphaera lusitana TaxID=1936003 RepID=A0A1U9NJ30_9BACT|nr:hydroxymethylbilane synthase [Anaerohalosphaera lusitana]AQT67734.1 Porphobilinogen deaminase [Anaerohalosphaera lusitana]
MPAIRIATRASKLAIAQTKLVCNMLREVNADLQIELVEISTRGDRDKSDFLYKSSSSVGFFTSELEKALLENAADVAVHSFKDLPTAITPGLAITAVPKRVSPADALICSDGSTSIKGLKPGAVVGTSSVRRIAQLKHLRPDVHARPCRGNVDTRIGKLRGGQYDALILAHAGLIRMGKEDEISAVLPFEDFLPAPAQGALAIQTRSDDKTANVIVSQIDDNGARLRAELERRILARLHGGCSIPLGALAMVEGDAVSISAMIADPAGEPFVREQIRAQRQDAEAAADELAESLLANGGAEILARFNRDRE